MRAAEILQALHKKNGTEGPIAGFSDEELAHLQAACGHPLPEELRAVLKAPGVHQFGADVYIEDVGRFCLAPPATMIEDAANLHGAAGENDWELPACCALSLSSNRFIAYDFDKKSVIAIDGNDGEVSELPFDLEGIYAHVAELWEKELS